MATKLLHPLLMLIAQATEKELVQYIEYLKAENRILRNKLPKRINVTPAERAKLIKLSSHKSGNIPIGERKGFLVHDLQPETLVSQDQEGAHAFTEEPVYDYLPRSP